MADVQGGATKARLSWIDLNRGGAAVNGDENAIRARRFSWFAPFGVISGRVQVDRGSSGVGGSSSA